MFLESPPERYLHIPAHPEQLIPFHRERKGLGGIGLPTASTSAGDPVRGPVRCLWR